MSHFIKIILFLLVNKVGKLTNCSIPITTYVARHSWATIAKRGGISTSVISEGVTDNV